jgi:hypothetical protein
MEKEERSINMIKVQYTYLKRPLTIESFHFTLSFGAWNSQYYSQETFSHILVVLSEKKNKTKCHHKKHEGAYSLISSTE